MTILHKSGIGPGVLSFTCNICGAACTSHMSMLGRENPSCQSCGSTVRMRSMMYAVSVALFNEELTLPNFPTRKDIIGLGMSDWDVYAMHLSRKLGYKNTFYHKAPRLDITDISTQTMESLDFLVSSDVFEHVAPPVSIAFTNARKMIKPGGAFVFSVPFTLEAATIEHFPNLHSWQVTVKDGQRVLLNQTRHGESEEFSELVFHGGDGSTLEMRVFSQQGVLLDLHAAGFKDVTVLSAPCFDFGIYWPQPWSIPIIAR